MKKIAQSLLVLSCYYLLFNQVNAQTVSSGNIYTSSGEIAAIYTIHHPTCFNSATGIVSFQLMNDSFNVEWVDGSNNIIYKNLYAGDYQFSIQTDISKIFYKISLEQPEELTGNIEQIKEGSKFHLDLSIDGGVWPYTYEWSNGSNDEDLSNVDPGFYSVLIKDKNECSLSLNAKINKVEKPNIDIKN